MEFQEYIQTKLLRVLVHGEDSRAFTGLCSPQYADQVKKLVLEGFKLIPDCVNYMINAEGTVRLLSRNRVVSPTVAKGVVFIRVRKIIGKVKAQKKVNTKPTKLSLAKLVADLFHPGWRDEGKFIGFKDGNSLNVRLDNLKFLTYEQARPMHRRAMNERKGLANKAASATWKRRVDAYKYYFQGLRLDEISLLVHTGLSYCDLTITEARNPGYKDDIGIENEVWRVWLNHHDAGYISRSLGLTVNKVKSIINAKRLELIKAIEADAASGIIHYEEPKRLTKSQQLDKVLAEFDALEREITKKAKVKLRSRAGKKPIKSKAKRAP